MANSTTKNNNKIEWISYGNKESKEKTLYYLSYRENDTNIPSDLIDEKNLNKGEMKLYKVINYDRMGDVSEYVEINKSGLNLILLNNKRK